MTRTLTGWHVLAIFCGAFAIIIGVNLTLAVQAVRTFPGLEVANSYVASQSFDADRAAQDALGWDVAVDLRDGVLRLDVTGADGRVVFPEVVSAVLGRATERQDDRTPAFVADATGLAAEADVAPGQWILRLDLRAADGTPFHRSITLSVPQERG